MNLTTGIVPVLKSGRINSSRVTSAVKRKTGLKAGHYGTLDPMAEGVLPVMVGSSTRLSDFLDKEKVYKTTLKLGSFTDTADITGRVISEKPVSMPSEDDINDALGFFLGKIKQRPPIYSALSVNGRKLYSYARDNQQVEIPEREITVYSIECTGIDREKEELSFVVSCSAGTYIRTLCEDIAKALGNAGTMSGLMRLKSAGIGVEQCVSIEEFTDAENWEKYLVNPEKLLEKYPASELHASAVKYYLNGGSINSERFGAAEPGIYRAYRGELFLGLARAEYSEGELFVKSIWKP